MAAESTQYVKTLEDELDWSLLDQLHRIVLQIGGFCYETKKYCVTTEFVVLTLVVKFTGDRLDRSIFVTGAMIAVCFWFLDAVAYYYQVKLRGTMDSIQQRLRVRQSKQILDPQCEPIIQPERVNVSWPKLVVNAAFNHSMWLYGLLLVIDLIVWLLFFTGKIVPHG